MTPSIVYVNLGTANTFYSYGVNYTIGHWDKGSSDVIDSDIDCANIRINQGDAVISGGNIYNFYRIGNGIGGDMPRSFNTVIDDVRIFTGHSSICFNSMAELALNVFNAELRSYGEFACIYDGDNGNVKLLKKILGKSYIDSKIPDVSFGDASLNIDTARLCDVKGLVTFELPMSGQSYQPDHIIFPAGHISLLYETDGLEAIVPHNSTESIVKATPQADGSIKTVCACGLDMAEPIPAFSDIKLQYTQTSYGGNAQSPYVYYVKDREGKELVKDVDYTVSYKNNVNVGTAVVTVTGTGEFYAGSIDKNFEITPGNIQPAVVTGITDQTYIGSEITPEPVVTLKDKILVKGKDYTVSYQNNVDAGTAKVIITGIGNYINDIYVEFKIVKPEAPEPDKPSVPDIPVTPDQPVTPEPEQPAPEKTLISSAVVSKVTAKTYTGSAIRPEVTVKAEGKTLIEGTDYTVAYKNNVNAGTASVIINGTGNYTGSKTVNFVINPKKITSMNLAQAEYVYNGTVRQPAVTVKSGTKAVAQKIRKDNTNIDVTYAKGRKNVGKYKVTVKGKGNYTGTLSKSFKINPKATALTSLKKAKKSFNIKWTKRTVQVTGYEVMYATNKQFTKGKKTVTVKNYKTNYKKVTGLRSGKKYFVKVRTYKNVNGVKYYSAWSPVKNVIVK